MSQLQYISSTIIPCVRVGPNQPISELELSFRIRFEFHCGLLFIRRFPRKIASDFLQFDRHPGRSGSVEVANAGFIFNPTGV